MRFRYFFLPIVCLAAMWPLLAHAASDCPSALKGKGSYVLEQGPDARTEVFYSEGSTVRTEYRLRDRKLLETTLYRIV